MSFVCQYVNSLYTGNKINCKFGNKCVCRTVIFISILLLRVVMVFLNSKQILLKRMTQRNFPLVEVFVYIFVYLVHSLCMYYFQIAKMHIWAFVTVLKKQKKHRRSCVSVVCGTRSCLLSYDRGTPQAFINNSWCLCMHHLWENMSHSLQRKWVPAFYTCTRVVILHIHLRLGKAKLLTCPSSSAWAQCQITFPDARWKPGIPLSRKLPGWLIGMTGIQIHWSCMCCHSEQWAVFTPKCLRDAQTIWISIYFVV